MLAPTPRHAGFTTQECTKCKRTTHHEILEIPPRSAEEKHTTEVVCLECKPFFDELEE